MVSNIIKKDPQISVIMIHYYQEARQETLLSSLIALTNQTFKNFQFIFVVDNARELPKSVLDIIDNLQSILDISKSRRGPAWCRKIGVEIASSEYVAFIDDDAIPEKNWIEEIFKCIDESNLIAVGGSTLTYNTKTKIQKFSKLDKSQFKPLTNSEGAIFNISTVNACFRRDILIDTGIIHENYVQFALAGHYFFFEDYDITYRIIEKFGNKDLGFAANAIVYHNHRTCLNEAFKQFKEYGKGASFWLWSYKKRPNELEGGQNLPQNLDCIFEHLIELLRSFLKYRKHYFKARSQNNTFLFSIQYALYGFSLRIAFHFGAFQGCRLLKRISAAQIPTIKD